MEVNGKPLIGHVTDRLWEAGAQRIAMVLHTRAHAVEAYCRAAFPHIAWHVAYRDTPHSFATLLALQELLLPERFLLSTVDAIVPAGGMRAFAAAAQWRSEPVVLGVTDCVDDEKPLWVRWSATGTVSALGPEAAGSGWVTAGVYAFSPEVLRVPGNDATRHSSLRQFLAHCVNAGIGVAAVSVGRAVDVDRPQDIVQASRLLEGR